ncbi:MAG: C4-type zinc ribbon domain-containing protein [Chloroflexi bacterium]|nr:C4-type zinc ribbon domain-containing protein [Chloroflexota bacterium]
MTELRQLYELQELDTQIDELTKTLAELESQLADDSVVAEANRRVAILESHAEQLAANRRSIDRAIEDLQARLGRTQERMYSGSIKSVKEMEAAEEERASTEREIAENEDRLLEVMVRDDEVDDTLAKGREVVKRLEEQRSAAVAELTARVEEIRASLDELTPRRDSTWDAISAPVLHRYETLRSSKGGTAIATVERGMCSGCRMTLSTSEHQRIRSASDPMQCSSCHRILYFP